MPIIALTGTLTCTDPDRAMVAALLPGHIAATRAEPGCLWFQVVADRCNPCTFLVAERFASRAAFDAHQTRTGASEWGRATAHLTRAFRITELPGPVPDP